MYNDLDNKNRVVVGLIITLALLFFCAGMSIYQFLLPVVVIKVDSVTIRQEQEFPEFAICAEYKGKKTTVLDETSGYTSENFVDDLNDGKGIQVVHNADHMTEGVYEMQIQFDDELKDKLVFSWHEKIRYQVQVGEITVLNKYGDWEEDKFKLLDGSYASGWVNMGEDTYYFDEEGKRVTGEKQIGLDTYYFKKDGKFDIEKNPINPSRPMIALTFDDGPGLYTERLVSELKKYGVRATFFMIGSRCLTYPQAVKAMLDAECEIANHTSNHLKLTDYPIEGVSNEINYTRDVINSIVGQRPTLVRPPYGAVNEVVQSAVDVPIALWSVDTLDWELKNAGLIRDYVLHTVKDGDIVLLHDIYESTVQAAIELIPLLQERGYQIVTVSEMARARGIQMERGVKYYSFYK